MARSTVTIAYLTVIHEERTGWTGGLLILNAGGRPLEFQCTLPIRPSRAHQILFGSTLRQHLIGEVIGPLLVKSCRTPISMLCCDQPETLALETAAQFPICLVVEAAAREEGPVNDDTLMGSEEVLLAGTPLRVPMEQATTAREVAQAMVDLPDAVEPFERIREAINEAHSQLARAAQSSPSPSDTSATTLIARKAA